MKPDLLIGAHVSTRGGFHKAAERAFTSGALSFQFFSKNPRSLQIKQFAAAEADACKQYCLERGLRSIAHTPYPTNPAIGDSRGNGLYEATVASLRNDLNIAEGCGADGIILHFGHLRSADPLEGYRNIIRCIDDVLDDWQGTARILLENEAGSHGPMGTTMEEMVQIRSLCRRPEHIGFCFDTCHAFVSGLWTGKPDEEWMERGHTLGYWSGLGAVHFNDSLYAGDSRKDRHARVGQGRIGTEGLRWLARQSPLANIPVVLESAAGPDGTHRADIEAIREWSEFSSQP